MKEKKERKKIREFLKSIKVNRKAQIVTAVLACAILAGVSITVYSKYYKTGYNPGMAVASGFYFNSNFMASVNDFRNKTMEDIVESLDDTVLETIIKSANDVQWDGSQPYNFHVEVRNYDNQLLYNDKDLDVEYEVYFMLMDKPVGASYSISFGTAAANNQVTQTLKEGEFVKFKGTLPGGKVNYDDYVLSVKKDENSQDVYQSTDVLMVAYPIGPDYLQGTKAIAGIIRATLEEKEFKIEDTSGFKIRTEEEYGDDTWQDMVLQESAYEFRLYTTGSYTGKGAATRKKIQVMWRSDLYKFNEFDEYYKKAVADGKVRDTSAPEGYTGGTWKVMEIDVLPFASLKFLFFRNGNDSFETTIKGMSDEALFKNSVYVDVVKDEDTSNP